MIPAIVLAAGRSTRMGRAKALLPIGPGETFLSRIVRTLRDAEVDDVVIVIGHEPQEIVADVERRGLPVRFALNPDFDKGQLSSLVAGLNVIDRPGVLASLITLVDVPLISPATVRAVVDRYRATRARIVRPGGRIFVSEVYNQSLCVEPAQPSVERYWAAVNTTQTRAGGHPNVGARLGD